MEIDQDNLHMKFSAFNVDFSSPSLDPLDSTRIIVYVAVARYVSIAQTSCWLIVVIVIVVVVVVVVFVVVVDTVVVYLSVACPGEYEICSGDEPLPMAIFELLEYIVNEVSKQLRLSVCLHHCFFNELMKSFMTLYFLSKFRTLWIAVFKVWKRFLLNCLLALIISH